MSEPTPGKNVSIDTAGFQINIVNSQVADTVGAVMLGLLALILLLALLRAQRRNRTLLDQLRPAVP